jgi:DNA-binding transcriptional MerR regulator
MIEWRIKEISDLTKTSIRMLRHYDKIDLLKPSYRSANGYRCYTAQDLATLQQIIALRYFGFNLGTIKAILQKHHNIYAHLRAQQQVLKEQSAHLQQVNNALHDILDRLSPSEAPNWNDLITLIERYRMTENLRDKLKKTWAGQELSESQFEEYLSLYEQFPEEFAARDKIIEQINHKKLGDPTGPDGEHVAHFMHDLGKKMKGLFSKKVKFNSSLLQSMQSGKLSQLQVTSEGAMWLTRATISFWLKRWNALYDTIVENLKSDPEGKIGKKIAGEWTGLIDEYFSIGSRSFFTGMLLWQEFARQEDELKESKTALSPQDMTKKYHINLFFNPEAASWISRALEVHTQ